MNLPIATGVSFPSASTVVASNWWCNSPFFGVKINRKSLKNIYNKRVNNSTHSINIKLVNYLPNVVKDNSFTLFNGCGLSVVPRFTMLWDNSEECKVSKCTRFS